MQCSVLAALALLCAISSAAAIWPFPPKRFKGNSLVDAGLVGLDPDGRIVAFGDFNGDQFLDVLSLGTDMKTLTVFTWNHISFQFEKTSSIAHTRRIYNIVPGDFTQDGLVDLLVMSESMTSNQLDLTLYIGSQSGNFDVNPVQIPPSSLSQPIPIDISGNMRIDLIGMGPSSGGSLQVWKNTWNSSKPGSPLFDVQDADLPAAQCKLSNPHSSAVIDLNGDCLADLFLICDGSRSSEKSFQIWVNGKSGNFSLAQTSTLPPGSQAVSFADIDRDGTIDMIFPSCSSVSTYSGIGTDCYINIVYNQQLPLCASRAGSALGNESRTCREPNNLCSADPGFKFDLSNSANNKAFARFPVASLFPSTTGPHALLVLDTSVSPSVPVPLKFGDFNLDGFPDILIIAVDVAGHRIPHLISNVPCAKNIPGCGESGNGRRGWTLVQHGVDSLSEITDARGAAFLDMDEDGTLDLMILRSGQQGRGNVRLVQNNIYYDAFFLKSIVVNSPCEGGWCTTPNSTEQYRPHSLSYSGASYKFTVLDTSGRRSAAAVGQLPQTSYQSLLTPYSFSGLGRTNNYIENLFVGSTKHIRQHYINMEGVIPNSKVVILPPPGEAEDGWKRELFLRPGEWIPLVTLTVVVATVILAAIVGVLHWNEKREDELERRLVSHHINFDAL